MSTYADQKANAIEAISTMERQIADLQADLECERKALRVLEEARRAKCEQEEDQWRKDAESATVSVDDDRLAYTPDGQLLGRVVEVESDGCLLDGDEQVVHVVTDKEMRKLYEADLREEESKRGWR